MRLAPSVPETSLIVCSEPPADANTFVAATTGAREPHNQRSRAPLHLTTDSSHTSAHYPDSHLPTFAYTASRSSLVETTYSAVSTHHFGCPDHGYRPESASFAPETPTVNPSNVSTPTGFNLLNVQHELTAIASVTALDRNSERSGRQKALNESQIVNTGKKLDSLCSCRPCKPHTQQFSSSYCVSPTSSLPSLLSGVALSNSRPMTLENKSAAIDSKHSNFGPVVKAPASVFSSSASSSASPSSSSSPASSPAPVAPATACPVAATSATDTALALGLSSSGTLTSDTLLFSRPYPFQSYHRNFSHPHFPPPPHLSHRSPSTPEDLAAIARSAHSPSSPSSVVTDYLPPRAPSPPGVSMHAISPNGPARPPTRPPPSGLSQTIGPRPTSAAGPNLTPSAMASKHFVVHAVPASGTVMTADDPTVSATSTGPSAVVPLTSETDVFGCDITNGGASSGSQLLSAVSVGSGGTNRSTSVWGSSQTRSVMDAIQEDFPRTPSLLQEDFPRLPIKLIDAVKNQTGSAGRDANPIVSTQVDSTSSPAMSDDIPSISRIVATLDLNHPLDDFTLPSARRSSVSSTSGHRRSASINWTGDTSLFSDVAVPSMTGDASHPTTDPSAISSTGTTPMRGRSASSRRPAELPRSPSDMYISNFTNPSRPPRSLSPPISGAKPTPVSTLQVPPAQQPSSPTSFRRDISEIPPVNSFSPPDGAQFPTYTPPYSHHHPSSHQGLPQQLPQFAPTVQQQARQPFPPLHQTHKSQPLHASNLSSGISAYNYMNSSVQSSAATIGAVDDAASIPGTGNTYSLPLSSYSSAFSGFNSSVPSFSALPATSGPFTDTSNVAAFRDGLAAADSLKTMSMQMAAFLNAQQQLYAAQMAQMAAITSGTASIASVGPFGSVPASVLPGARAVGGARSSKGLGDSCRTPSHGSRKGVTVGGHGLGRGNRRGSRAQEDAVAEISHIRSPLLEEFRATSMGIGGVTRDWQLSDIKEHVVEFATDQHGSRFIQQRLETASREDLDAILLYALADVHRLITDVFGNYVVQKLLEHGGEPAVTAIARKLEGRMLSLSLHMYGCRVVQKALEVLNPIARASLVKELDGQVTKCIHDQNANHVIQKCIEVVEPESMQFVVDAVQNHAVVLASHSYGCRVVQRLLEHGAEEQKRPIMAEIMSSIADLIKDTFANYVVQHVVEHGSQEERSFIINFVRADVCRLSQHKFASNVVERCLQHGSVSEREVLIEILIGDNITVSPLNDLVRDSFGNYVVQRILDVALPSQRERVVNILRLQVPVIKKYSYGKHIIARLGDDAPILPHEIPQHLLPQHHEGHHAGHHQTYQQF